MKKTILIVMALALSHILFSRPVPMLFTKERTGNYQAIATRKGLYCITRNEIYKIEKARLILLQTFPFVCNEAAVYKDTILLATDSGIKKFLTESNTTTDFLPKQATGNINHLQVDAVNSIWFTKEFEGCFKIGKEADALQIVHVPVTYSLAYTPDSIIWVGTNVGLYQVPVSGKEIERYAEEGIADNDLPDNLVERLFSGNQNGVWAVMPGHITFISPELHDGGPDLENIGGKNNNLLGITELPEWKQHFLFATSEGVLYMPDHNDLELFRIGEIHQTITEKAYRLSDDIIQTPPDFKNKTIKKIDVVKDVLYFFTDKGFWALPAKKCIRAIKNQYEKHS